MNHQVEFASFKIYSNGLVDFSERGNNPLWPLGSLFSPPAISQPPPLGYYYYHAKWLKMSKSFRSTQKHFIFIYIWSPENRERVQIDELQNGSKLFVEQEQEEEEGEAKKQNFFRCNLPLWRPRWFQCYFNDNESLPNWPKHTQFNALVLDVSRVCGRNQLRNFYKNSFCWMNGLLFNVTWTDSLGYSSFSIHINEC